MDVVNANGRKAIKAKGFVSDEEAASLIRNYMEDRRGVGVTEDELLRLTEWCDEQRPGAMLVDMLIEGTVRVVELDEDGEPLFQRIDQVER